MDEKVHKVSKATKGGLVDSERTPCSVYSRVMGYFQPTHLWNIGKRGEWDERKNFKEPTTEVLNGRD